MYLKVFALLLQTSLMWYASIVTVTTTFKHPSPTNKTSDSNKHEIISISSSLRPLSLFIEFRKYSYTLFILANMYFICIEQVSDNCRMIKPGRLCQSPYAQHPPFPPLSSWTLSDLIFISLGILGGLFSVWSLKTLSSNNQQPTTTGDHQYGFYYLLRYPFYLLYSGSVFLEGSKLYLIWRLIKWMPRWFQREYGIWFIWGLLIESWLLVAEISVKVMMIEKDVFLKELIGVSKSRRLVVPLSVEKEVEYNYLL
ncbi:8709_t:CDS:1 [Ambispora gerdemannii]|uniref:8709_t:CDS:1 n=1 Tax=Ambispora gerdemannii TaxID=144530 RepID=A0A9N8W9M6_9GLOM|nr:8709_t:CDS:1 [Ambispora gerdemannii]